MKLKQDVLIKHFHAHNPCEKDVGSKMGLLVERPMAGCLKRAGI